MGNKYFTRQLEMLKGEKTDSSNNGVGKTAYSHAKEWNRTDLLDIGLDNDFLDMTPKAQAVKQK